MGLLPRSLFVVLAPLLMVAVPQEGSKGTGQSAPEAIALPAPRLDGSCSVEKALAMRRSVRAFKEQALSIAEVSQLAWAAQGITLRTDAPPDWRWGTWQGGRRTAPSAGALYPLELYIFAGHVDGLKPGVYKYKPQAHQLIVVATGDRRGELAKAALGQEWIRTAPCVFVVGAVYRRTEAKYRERAPRYVHIEVGHAVENICLQAVALNLGTTMVGAFSDDEVKKVAGMAEDEQPLALVPAGRGTQ